MDTKTAVKPNFLFIGGDRCGSKWLHNLFKNHPDCYVPDVADPYYFDKNYHRGQEWYEKLFKDVPGNAIAIGEFSHDYIHSEEAAKRIAADLPDVKLIATLRHPVDRSYSSWAASREAGMESLPFNQAIEKDPGYLEDSLYADKLDVYYSLFKKEQIKIMLYDQLMSAPQAFAQEVFEFVGVDFVNNLEYEVIFNPLRKSRGGFGGTIAKQAAELLRRLGYVTLLGKLKHNRLVRSIFFSSVDKGKKKPGIEPTLRQELISYFEPQIMRLESRLSIDLSNWRT